MNRKKQLILATLTIVCFCSVLPVLGSAGRVYLVRYIDGADGVRQLVFKGWVDRRSDHLGESIHESSLPQTIGEAGRISTARLVELWGLDAEAIGRELEQRGVSGSMEVTPGQATDEVQTLVSSGPSANRIDVVFLGDGYTADERGKFFSDIGRLVDEMFRQETFRSYLPLFNVHAVFRASRQSGIGRGTPLDTAYRLYREGNTLRIIYCQDLAAARESVAAAPGCEYPVIIANDPYYGGTGGEFAISTSSLRSGTMTLRHELGHTMGDVGEEYDGGGYFGANYAQSLTNVTWTAWQTGSERPPVAEPARALVVSWPWHCLSEGAYTATFNSPGDSINRLIRISASGLGDPADRLDIFLDNTPLPPFEPVDPDRIFFDINLAGGFSAGVHTLAFSEGHADGDNWLSSLNVYEYGSGFHSAPAYIGAFPLFSQPGQLAGFRPTNESCLMRDMNFIRFCSVCQENLWLKFLDKVSLIDDVSVERDGRGKVAVSASLVGLGQLRPAQELVSGERLRIRWFHFGVEITALEGKVAWERSRLRSFGPWIVEVTLQTPEVRADAPALLVHREIFLVGFR